jgi:hypothetical protein
MGAYAPMNERVRINDAEGICLVRDNLLVVFFGQRPFADMVEGAAYCVERYLDMVPTTLLRWSIIGMTSSTHKPLTDGDLARCRSMLTAKVAKQKDVHFRLMGPDKYGPDFRLVVLGVRNPRKAGFQNQTNVVEMRFPRQLLATIGEDAFVATVTELFGKLPCDSGYASVALCYGKESRYDKAAAYIAPLAMRSHGFDVPNTLWTATRLGKRCRGARWLTMLSTALLDELGGRDALRDTLLDSVEMTGVPNGMLLRAGRTPEIGDVNRNETTPALASVARAIEPVTYFGDNSLLALFGHDEERVRRWERRFWAQS